MSVISITRLYNMLAPKIGEEAAENLTGFIKQEINLELENKSKILATKEDISKTKVDLIKWVIALWITLVILILGLYLK